MNEIQGSLPHKIRNLIKLNTLPFPFLGVCLLYNPYGYFLSLRFALKFSFGLKKNEWYTIKKVS